MPTEAVLPSKAWFTLAEFAAERLPGLPTTQVGMFGLAERHEWRRADWRDIRWRERAGVRGGGFEYHYSVLDQVHQAALLIKHAPPGQDADEATLRALKRDDAWQAWDRATDRKKKKALHKVAVVSAFETLRRSGDPIEAVVRAIGAVYGVPQSTLYRWRDEAVGFDASDRLAVLTPRHAGRASSVECSTEAWDWLMADYLRPAAPNLSDCLRRLREKNRVDAMGWALPSDSTLARRANALSPAMVCFCREGIDAVKKRFPAQQRDRSMFHALEAINGDGHKWDVFVRWPDGTVGRPMMVAFQDLYSGMILSWRVARSENKETIRLALGDVFERYGIPDHCWLDNGRGFASKWITGRTPNRFRFKIKDEDPEGVLTSMDVKVHWTLPYSGQSKPIERAFRDLAQGLSKHPVFDGAYTGSSPVAKPADYGAKAVPLETFLGIVAAGIAAHNARPGRNTRVCDGRLSFEQAFAASYATAPIRRASEKQRRMWLMAAENVRVNARDGALTIHGNRYWHVDLERVLGKTVTVRFDPDRLHEPLHVYRSDSSYLCAAECIAAVGFADVDAARAHAQKRGAWLRGLKAMRDAEGGMTIDQLAAALPADETPAPMPETKIVRPSFGAGGFGTTGNAALQARADEDAIPEGEALLLKFSEMRRGGPLRVIEGDGEGDD